MKKTRTGEEFDKGEIHVKNEDADTFCDNSGGVAGYGSSDVEAEI